uniref:COesterase domain-containing protein n=1 Tax=Macrostomum lignano TaxID=282301 RepID=A0A1I8GWX5_9PLAT
MANNYEPDDGGFSGRYGNGRHQRQLQQKQNKQVATQRFSYADPMSDGTLRGIANPDYQLQSTENFFENSSSKQQRPQDLPVFTVSGPKVAFNSEPPGESSTDAIGSYWLDQQDNQKSGFLSSRPRLILAAIILLLIALAVILVITLPTVLVSNRHYQQSLQAAAAARNADNRRREASGTRRETTCGVLTATSVTGSGSAMVYRFTGIPYALRPNGTRLLLPAQPIDSQTACREVWAMTSEEANTAWHQRRLRYPHSADAVPMCLQYAGMGDSPTAGLEGSTDCLYLDLATPAEKPGANLPTV